MKELNPVQRFAVLSSLCIVGLGLALALAIASLLEHQMREVEWLSTAGIVNYQVAEHNLLPYFTDPQIRQEPARYREAFQGLLGMPEVVRIKVWDREATILWSDDERLIGRRFPENPEVSQALAGQVSVALKTLRKAEQEYERERFARLAEIYVPIPAKPSGAIIGIVEVYKLPARLFADIRRMQIIVWGIALAGGVLLYVLLLPIVRHAYRKQLELEGSLREHAQHLEELVERRTSKLAEWSRRLEALYGIAHTLSTERSMQRLIGRLVADARALVRARYAAIGVMNEEGRLTDFTPVGLTPEEVRAIGDPPSGRGLLGFLLQHDQPVRLEDLAQLPSASEFPQNHPPMRTFLGVPILIQGKPAGALYLTEKEGGPFLEEDERLVEAFANSAAVALENARLFEAVQHHATTLEARVRERTAELEEALRVKVEFLANMSHELRTPLNFILGFSDLLKQGTGGTLTSKQAHYLERIHTGGKRLLELVTGILALTETESNTRRLRLAPLSLAPLVQEVLASIQAPAAQKGLVVQTALDPGLPLLVADRAKLAQILTHLLGNAVKFTPEGGRITVIARRVSGPGDQSASGGPTPAAGEWLELAVADSGIGLRPEELEPIFGAFHQVDGSATRAYEGAGLGLALVRQLVELHGGRVWGESAGPGQGARFIVWLPWLEPAPPKQILLVEDQAPLLGKERKQEQGSWRTGDTGNRGAGRIAD